MDNTLTEGISLNRGLPFFYYVQVNYKCTTKQTNNDTKSSIFVSLMIYYGKCTITHSLTDKKTITNKKRYNENNSRTTRSN